MALNNSINTAALGAGFVYSDGLGGLSIGTPSGGGSVKLTKFTSSGTWTKDADCQSVTVVCWNGGFGGGSGRQGLTTAAGGGAGGNQGSDSTTSYLASFFGATETVTIGAGGAGGLTQASASSNGNNGSVGGITSLGNVTVFNDPATISAGGTATNANTGGQSYSYVFGPSQYIASSLQNGGSGRNIDASNVGGSSFLNLNPINSNCSGGGGSGADSVVARQAGSGGPINMPTNASTAVGAIISAGGTGGIASGTINGGAGNNAITTTGGRYVGATGGGGGGGQSGGASAGIGGAGGIPGGGGGGGGGSLNGTTSGAGGAGGRGELWVIEYLS